MLLIGSGCKWSDKYKMWPSILDIAKMNPFGTPFVTTTCQRQNELTQALVKNRHIAAASVASGGQ